MATEPLAGWRTTDVAERRTYFMREHVIDRYPKAKEVVLVMGNINTHTTVSFYDAYPQE